MHEKKFCTHCGTALSPDARFCQACEASTTETREPSTQTVPSGTRENKSKFYTPTVPSYRITIPSNRMGELGKTLTLYLTGFILVLFLFILVWPLGIIAFFAWMYIIYKYRQGKRARTA